VKAEGEKQENYGPLMQLIMHNIVAYICYITDVSYIIYIYIIVTEATTLL
jgi:hypothetical protein